MTFADDWAQTEHRILASYAAFSDQSRGRTYSEPPHARRTCFQRDRDRIIHCAAFRRLEDKTQVLLQSDKDYFRTRLTHTIEVAQIARTLARVLGVNEDLAETVALAHDLGHAPYGHCGEATLNQLMKDHGGFEHNRHCLRVVDYLEHPYPAFRGLNLSYEVRLCLAKHETKYDQPELNAEFPQRHAPLEGQIVDLADLIAYNSHDLDDALVAGLIAENDLLGLDMYQILLEQVRQRYGELKEHTRALRCAKGLIDLLMNDAVEQARQRLCELRPAASEAICQAPQRIMTFSAEMARKLSELESFLLHRVYRHADVLQAEQRAAAQLQSLFTMYLNFPDRLPPRYQDRIAEQGPHRVICDYIAGMTDRYAGKAAQALR